MQPFTSNADTSLWLKILERDETPQTNKKDDGQKLAGYNLKIDWLYVVLRPVWEYSTHLQTSTLPVKGCRVRPMQGACSLWGGRSLYRATHAMTRDLGLIGLIGCTALFSRLLPQSRYTEVCRPILLRILMSILI